MNEIRVMLGISYWWAMTDFNFKRRRLCEFFWFVMLVSSLCLCPRCEAVPAFEFATQPTDQTAVLGSTVVLPCRVISNDATVQWTRDGFGLGTIRRLQGFDRYSMIGSDEEGDFSLRISPVTLEDDSVYQCQVSSPGGPKLRSRIARLTVFVPPNPPTVDASPEVEATAGVNVSIKCTSVGGRPAPEIQWIDETGGKEFREGIRYSEEAMEDGLRVKAESVLTFAPTRLHHLTTLTCLTHNPALNEPLASRVVLRVRFPPQIQLDHNPANLVEGKEASVRCGAEANPSDVRYRWLRGGNEVRGADAASLHLGVLTKDDHGATVACEATNSVGTVRRTQSLDVKFGPRFKSSPESASSEPDSNVSLRCDAEANPAPVVTWRHLKTNKVVGTGSELRLRASEETAGTYLCVALSKGYGPLEGRVHLRLRGPPVISASREVAARLGHAAQLRCQVKAVPHPLAVTWTKNGLTINPDASGRVRISEKQRADGVDSVLTINGTEDSDFAAYNCSVVNEYGIDVKEVTLRKKAMVPVVFVIGGSVTVVLIVIVVVLFVVFGRKPKTSSISKSEKSCVESAGNGMAPAIRISPSPDSQMKQDICDSSKNCGTELTIIPASSLNHHTMNNANISKLSTGGIRAKGDARISDTDSDMKEMDTRTGSSLSAIERESEKWDGADKALGAIPPRSPLQYQMYHPQSALLNSQNSGYMTYSDYSWGHAPVQGVPPDSGSQFKLSMTPYSYSPNRPPHSMDIHGPLPNTSAPPPYSPTPAGGLVGVNGLTSRLNGSSNGRLSNGVTTIVSGGASLRHDLIADLQQPDLTRQPSTVTRADLLLREDPNSKDSSFHSKFILPPQANLKPGTLV